jgi:hypothetical protein
MVLTEARPEATTRFATVEELEQWVMSASDEEIVAVYEDSGVLSSERAEYGKELIEAAKARLEDSQVPSRAEAAAVAAD